MIRRWLPLTTPIALVLVPVIALVGLHITSGIHVTVVNAGATPLKSVVLHVTGQSYELGDIAPSAAATQKVKASGESDLEIEFLDAEGQRKRLPVDVYFESGYRGTLRTTINDGGIDGVEQDVKMW